MKRKLLSVILATVMAVSLVGCGSKSSGETASSTTVASTTAANGETTSASAEYDEIQIRVGNMYNETTTQGQALDLFKENIEKASNGKITVDIYHGGSLGSEQAHIQAQKEGSIELLFSGTAGIGLYVPATAVYECWYAFQDMNQINEAVTSMKDDLDAAFQEQGFKMLGAFYDGPRQILTNKKITSLSELKGLKLRAPGANIYVNSITALGAQAISMPLGDVYTSLQTGAIDAMEGTVDLITQQKFYEQAKYLVQDAHVFQPLFITYNLDSWNKLSPATQELIQTEIQKCSDYQREQYSTVLEQEVKTLKDAGIEFVEISDRESWVQAVDVTSKAYAEENGDLGVKIYDTIKSLQK